MTRWGVEEGENKEREQEKWNEKGPRPLRMHSESYTLDLKSVSRGGGLVSVAVMFGGGDVRWR